MHIKLMPTLKVETIYDIDYINLLEHGINVFIFDYDGTLFPTGTFTYNTNLKRFMTELNEISDVVLATASGEKNKIDRICRNFPDHEHRRAWNAAFDLGIKKVHLDLQKLTIAYLEQIRKTYGYTKDQMIMIGNSYPFDIWPANRYGIISAKVNRPPHDQEKPKTLIKSNSK